MRIWSRFIQPFLICGFFAVMMAKLFGDYLLPRWELGDATPLSTASVLDTYNGTDEWLRLRVNGIPVGDMRVIVERSTEHEGFVGWLILDIQSPILRARLESTSVLNLRLEMEQVHVNVHWTGEEKADIELAGLVHQRRLLTRIVTPTSVLHRELPLQRPLTMNFAADQVLTSSAIQAGQTYAIDLFDPVWGLSAGRMRVKLANTENIEVAGRSTRTRVIEATLPTGLMRVWISDQNQIVRRAISLGRPDDEPGSTSSLASRFEIRLDQMTPEEITRSVPRLSKLPTPPNFSPSDLRGADQGDLLESVGLLPLILRSQLSQPRQEP
jgi:hypothetical protein